jgi:uncharacterized protein GlcG (DUF336 family)
MKSLALILALAQSAPAIAQTSTLGFEDAAGIASRAIAAARSSGRPIAVVVVNREGRVLVAMRMDGVSHINLDVAQANAVTAAALGAPTSALEKAVEAGKTSLQSVGGISLIGGGVPISRSGQVVAGIGVSGGSPQDDEAAALGAIGKSK